MEKIINKRNINKKELNIEKIKQMHQVSNQKTKEKKEKIVISDLILNDTSNKDNFLYLNSSKIKKIKNEYIRIDKIRKVANLFYYIKILNMLLLLNLFMLTSLNKNSSILKFLNSNITLKIKGIGYKNIFGIGIYNYFEKQYYPNEIYTLIVYL